MRERLFSRVFFISQGQKYTRKNLAETQSRKIQVKSGEIPVRKTVGKIVQNVDSRRHTSKSAKMTCCPILKIQSRQNTGKVWRYQKQLWQTGGFSYKAKKYISTIWNVGQFNSGQLGCETSLTQHFGSSKFLDKEDVGPATWAHINGYIDACKCTEIFFQQFLKVENQND